jgi:hypothetical protein
MVELSVLSLIILQSFWWVLLGSCRPQHPKPETSALVLPPPVVCWTPAQPVLGVAPAAQDMGNICSEGSRSGDLSRISWCSRIKKEKRQKSHHLCWKVTVLYSAVCRVPCCFQSSGARFFWNMAECYWTPPHSCHKQCLVGRETAFQFSQWSFCLAYLKVAILTPRELDSRGLLLKAPGSLLRHLYSLIGEGSLFVGRCLC